MSLIKIRFVERWNRLEGMEKIVWAFLMCSVLSIAVLWLLYEHRAATVMCRAYYNIRLRIPLSRDSACVPLVVLLGVALACYLATNAFKIMFLLFRNFCRPLQRRDFSPVLRSFLLLKRMRLERVLKNHSLELHFTTLADNFKPYRAFVLKIEAIQSFTFYDVDNKAISASVIFQEGAPLEFAQVADSTGLEYARIDVSCEYQGHYFSGQLELEAASHELRMMPKPVRDSC